MFEPGELSIVWAVINVTAAGALTSACSDRDADTTTCSSKVGAFSSCAGGCAGG
jgi:hypothetical protein